MKGKRVKTARRRQDGGTEPTHVYKRQIPENVRVPSPVQKIYVQRGKSSPKKNKNNMQRIGAVYAAMNETPNTDMWDRSKLHDLGVSTERVAGVTFRDVSNVKPGDSLILEPDPDNEHDPNAIKVICNNLHIGFIPAERAALMQLEEEQCGNILSIWKDSSGVQGIEVAWAEFPFQLTVKKKT